MRLELDPNSIYIHIYHILKSVKSAFMHVYGQALIATYMVGPDISCVIFYNPSRPSYRGYEDFIGYLNIFHFI